MNKFIDTDLYNRLVLQLFQIGTVILIRKLCFKLCPNGECKICMRTQLLQSFSLIRSHMTCEVLVPTRDSSSNFFPLPILILLGFGLKAIASNKNAIMNNFCLLTLQLFIFSNVHIFKLSTCLTWKSSTGRIVLWSGKVPGHVIIVPTKRRSSTI